MGIARIGLHTLKAIWTVRLPRYIHSRPRIYSTPRIPIITLLRSCMKDQTIIQLLPFKSFPLFYRGLLPKSLLSIPQNRIYGETRDVLSIRSCSEKIAGLLENQQWYFSNTIGFCSIWIQLELYLS